MIYLIPHGHVIVSFLNRIIIVSRGACPSTTYFKYREAHYPIPFGVSVRLTRLICKQRVTKSENRLADATFFQGREA